MEVGARMLETNLAFLKIAKRAERQDDGVLRKTFVDSGSVLAVLTSIDHQIIFGRRGTGKTHLLTVIRQAFQSKGQVAIQVDMRNLGSAGGIYSDPTIPITQRATRLLVDVLATIHGLLLEKAIDDPSIVDLGLVGLALDELFDSHRTVMVVGETIVESTTSAESSGVAESKLGIAASQNGLAANASLADSVSAKDSVTTKKTIKGQEVHRVNFGSVGTALRKVVDQLPGKRLWVLIDEWSEVPLDLQPLLADLLRRAILPCNGLSVKIAAIEQRSRFLVPDLAVGHIGIELGADVSTAINLDDYMVFDNDEDRAIVFFRKLVHAHVCSALEAEGLNPPKTEADLISVGFTQTNAFAEVVRACEGVPRDAIHILSHAAQKAGAKGISVNDVRLAAQQWYQGSKDAAVSAHRHAKTLLTWIVDQVIKERQAKAFLLEASTKDHLIDFLYDERVLHVLRRGISAKDSPGRRFNVYGIDYGCYVDLVNTAKAPKGVLDVGDGAAAFAVEVPKTDLRSIRRCVLNLADFYTQPLA
jgi:hypothetical protein